MASRLVVEDVHAGYGAVRVLHGVTVEAREGETVVLLGTNGNGKSTLIKSIMGIVAPARVIDIKARNADSDFAVLDAGTGAMKRFWGAYGKPPSDENPGPYDPAAAREASPPSRRDLRRGSGSGHSGRSPGTRSWAPARRSASPAASRGCTSGRSAALCATWAPCRDPA